MAENDKGKPTVMIVVLVAAVLVLLASMGTMQIKRAERKKMADEAISALQAVQSSLKVGVSYEEYNRKVIEAQTKVDEYASKYNDDQPDRMRRVLQPYIAAGAFWNHEITTENGEFIETPVDLQGFDPEKYPEVMKDIDDGGAYMSAETIYGDFHTIHCKTAMQILWERAGKELDRLSASSDR